MNKSDLKDNVILFAISYIYDITSIEQTHSPSTGSVYISSQSWM